MEIKAKLFDSSDSRNALITAYKLHRGGVRGFKGAYKVTRKELRTVSTKRSVLALFKALRFGKEDVDVQELDKKLDTQISIISDHYGNYGDNFTQEEVEAHPVRDGCYLVPGKTQPLRKAPKSQVPRHYRWHEEFASAGITIV